MKLQNIVNIISALLGIVGVIFLLRIMGTGDEQIEIDATQGSYSLVTPIIELARIVLILTISVTLIFSLRGLFSNKEKLKKASISIGFFLLIIFISYMASSGVETPMKDGKILSESGSRWVGTGILVFYVLFILAHKLIENEDKANKVSNIIAIIGLINIPVIRYSVDWWNTLHQPSSIKLDGTSSIHPSMLLPLMLMLLVLLLYCALILLMKYKTEIIRIKKKNIKRI